MRWERPERPRGERIFSGRGGGELNVRLGRLKWAADLFLVHIATPLWFIFVLHHRMITYQTNVMEIDYFWKKNCLYHTCRPSRAFELHTPEVACVAAGPRTEGLERLRRRLSGRDDLTLKCSKVDSRQFEPNADSKQLSFPFRSFSI